VRRFSTGATAGSESLFVSRYLRDVAVVGSESTSKRFSDHPSGNAAELAGHPKDHLRSEACSD
jgi:hypothetical protein